MRLFVALDLPWSLKQQLSRLAGGLPGARWVPPENYHLTLRFIGEMPAHRAEEVDFALASLRARGFSLTGILIPTGDAESFIKGSADAGLLRILK